jgi:hypothetical protein
MLWLSILSEQEPTNWDEWKCSYRGGDFLLNDKGESPSMHHITSADTSKKITAAAASHLDIHQYLAVGFKSGPILLWKLIGQVHPRSGLDWRNTRLRTAAYAAFQTMLGPRCLI